MRIKYQVAVCFIVPILFGCFGRHCYGDRNIKKTFQDQLRTVKEQHYGPEWVYDDDYRNAILYLRAVTNKGYNATISSTLGYKNENDYLTDMDSWAQWYKLHKCMLTQQYVDSALKQHNFKWVGKKYGGY
jgi:hypothetical protein